MLDKFDPLISKIVVPRPKNQKIDHAHAHTPPQENEKIVGSI